MNGLDSSTIYNICKANFSQTFQTSVNLVLQRGSSGTLYNRESGRLGGALRRNPNFYLHFTFQFYFLFLFSCQFTQFSYPITVLLSCFGLTSHSYRWGPDIMTCHVRWRYRTGLGRHIFLAGIWVSTCTSSSDYTKQVEWRTIKSALYSDLKLLILPPPKKMFRGLLSSPTTSSLLLR